MPHIQVGIEGIQKLLQGPQPIQAAGPDKVHTRPLKDISSSLAPVLSDLFQRSLVSAFLFYTQLIYVSVL